MRLARLRPVVHNPAATWTRPFLALGPQRRALSTFFGIKESQIFNLVISYPTQPSIASFVQRKSLSTSSLSSSTKTAFLDEEVPWLIGKVQKGFWAERRNQRHFMVWLAKQLKFSSMDDWYRVTAKDFFSNHGRLLLEFEFDGSPPKAVMTCFPEHTFLPWLFLKAPRGYFSIRENRQRYIDWLVAKTGVKKANDLEWNHFIANHGTGLILNFGGSPQSVLESLTTNGEVITRKTRSLHYWDSIENQRACLNEIGSRIGASPSNLAPWYKVDQKGLIAFGLPLGLLRKYAYSHETLIRAVYSDHEWDPLKFQSPARHFETRITAAEVLQSLESPD